MKILIAAVSSIGLMLAAAQAQPDREHDNRRLDGVQDRAQEHGKPHDGPARPQPVQAPQGQPAPQPRQVEPPQTRQHNRGPQIGGPNRREAPGGLPHTDAAPRNDVAPRDAMMPRRHGGPRNDVMPPSRVRPGFPSGPDRRDFDRGRRPDWDRFHGNFHADRRFHAGPWRPPHGYQYRRWNYGERLPSLYWSPSLWISSFALYGLMSPPPDTVWVRSGPDALLVDRDTGEIIRVEYGVFY